MNQTTYETVCQKQGCKNTVTGLGLKPKKRTCFECKRKKNRQRWHDAKINS